MITFVDAAEKSRRTQGVIPLHGEAGFAGMRKVGGLTAAALDMLVDEVKPGVTTARLDRLAFDFALDFGLPFASPFGFLFFFFFSASDDAGSGSVAAGFGATAVFSAASLGSAAAGTSGSFGPAA